MEIESGNGPTPIPDPNPAEPPPPASQLEPEVPPPANRLEPEAQGAQWAAAAALFIVFGLGGLLFVGFFGFVYWLAGKFVK